MAISGFLRRLLPSLAVTAALVGAMAAAGTGAPARAAANDWAGVWQFRMSNSNFGPAQLVFKQSGSGVTGVFGSPIPGGSVPYEGTVRGSVAGAVFTGTLTLTMGSWGYEKLEFPISLTLNPNRFMFDGAGGKNRDGIELRWSGYRDPATLTTPAAPAPRELGWEMPDRFGLLDQRGMIRYSKAKADQRSWPVIFTVPGCDPAKLGALSWQVDGKAAAGSKAVAGRKCAVSVDVGTLGRHEVTAKLPDDGQEYKASVVARDYVIVGLGDSVASGEGNPDVRKQAGGPLWQDPRCDRSAESFQAKAALAVEQSSRRTSVSFVHLACSGAAIGKGVSGPYWGISPGDADLPLASQTGRLRSLTAGREIDALLISIGANDLGFGDVLENAPTGGDEGKAGVGQRELAARPVEQPGAEMLFEFRHLSADGGQRHAETAAGR